MKSRAVLVAVIRWMFTRRRARNLLSVLFIVFAFIVLIIFFVIIDQLTSSTSVPQLADVDIQVIIIEEHHEALQYWFNAAKDGVIPKKNNLLIHIDAHSDDDNPEYIAGMPFFRRPKTNAEISYFMQKNDVFIQGAVMAKLVSRFIWIWPRWDSDRSSKSRRYESETVELGWFWVNKNARTIEFCRCERVVIDRDGTLHRRCSYNNETTEEETTISPELCHIRTSYMAEYVRADYAVDKMTSNPCWMTSGDDDDGAVIIDIDEDFFGCESPSDQLADRLANGSRGWQDVELIDEAMSKFLCPVSAQDESIADRFARRLVQIVIQVCHQRHATGSTCQPPQLDGVITSAFVGRRSMFCGNSSSEVNAAWKSVAWLLASVPTQHLRSVLELGFCLNTAPRTHNFRRQPDLGDFIVCYGANEPNSTLVYHHTPSVGELFAQMRLFDRLVAELLRQAEPRTRGVARRSRPLLVTVCRSVRDGYTPRSLAAHIETGILSALRRQRRSGTMTVIYDNDLLAGRGGWDNRP